MRLSGIVGGAPDNCRRVLLSRAKILFFALSLKSSGRCTSRSLGRPGSTYRAEAAIGCRIRCARLRAARLPASPRPPTGAETALFNYHRYFSGPLESGR